MSLKDTLPWAPAVTLPEMPPWVVLRFPLKAEYARVRLRAPVSVEFTVQPVRAKASDVATLTARKFGDLLKAGLKPGEAAHRLHTSLKVLMSKEQTHKEVKEIVEAYTLDATARKLLQRALVNKGVLDNAQERGDKKLLVDYLKMMGEDTEVGIKAPAAIMVPVGVDPSLKNALDLIPLPAGIEDGSIKDAQTEENSSQETQTDN